MRQLFIPNKSSPYMRNYHIKDESVAILIPTFGPEKTAFKTIRAISKWFPKMTIVVVDDSTPVEFNTSKTLRNIKKLTHRQKNIVYLRTPENKLKAGALNYGIDYLLQRSESFRVLFVFDDDVFINKVTIPEMIKALYSDKKVGAVCSKSYVKNKNTNLLTRLQALEYLSFNISKIADNGFLKGPLVMQGMLTAFRMSAIKKVKGYTVNHLIEDYDMTVRLKNKGWKVKIAQSAEAWTSVPETVAALWKQRIRWSYGGLQVMHDFWRNVSAVFQDLIGHVLFLALFAVVVLSLLISRDTRTHTVFYDAFFWLSLVNFLIAFDFAIITLFSLPQRDLKDIIIRCLVLPELLYSSLLSMVLMGSYLFFVYNMFISRIVSKFMALTEVYLWGLATFEKLGYSSRWGTR
jgi:cellulose synthase/poly-beta-1,6-N-acetylglucosamine synthase-like glycosyltransferase